MFRREVIESMVKLIFISICISFLFLAPDCYATMTFKETTGDNKVKSKLDVQVEVSDDTPTKEIKTLRSLNTELQVLITRRDDTIQAIADLQVLITQVNVEAEKPILKTDP